MLNKSAHIGDIIERVVGGRSRHCKIEYWPNYGITSTWCTTNGDGRYIADLASKTQTYIDNHRREGIDLTLEVYLDGEDVSGWSADRVLAKIKDICGTAGYREVIFDMHQAAVEQARTAAHSR